MSVGESIGTNVLADLIVKTLDIGYHIIRKSYLYLHEGEKMNLRLKVQIGILEAMNTLMQDTLIQQKLRHTDVATYAEVIKHLHKLLRKYVKRNCQSGTEKDELLNASSINELLNTLERQETLTKLSKQETASSKFWARMKEEAAWSVWAKERNEKLIVEIEFWGSRLDIFSSWIIPAMFARSAPADITTHLGDRRMEMISFKGRIMRVRAEITAEGNDESPLALMSTQVKFIGEGYISSSYLLAGPSQAIRRERRNELGGTDRRQWADLTDSNGNVSRVIVEFKAQLRLADAASQTGTETIKQELNILVRTLRLAERKGDRFRVLYCHGWYETFDHFGLVYKLPQTAPCETLSNILLSKEHLLGLVEDLENRFKLAKALAWTMLELHSVNWVHRAFNPDNILLFGVRVDRGIRFDWGAPYVVGFDSSRSHTGDSDLLTHGRKELPIRVYTHPDRQSREYIRYQKLHDIYSLGVVLLEIGRLKSFMAADWVDRLEKLSANNLKKLFVEKANALKSVMGQRFTKAVVTCLTAQFNSDVPEGDDYQFLSSFRDDVCEPLANVEI
jgi:hypothetical protein